MEPVVVTISHSLGKEAVLRRLRPALGQAFPSNPSNCDNRSLRVGPSVAPDLRTSKLLK